MSSNQNFLLRCAPDCTIFKSKKCKSSLPWEEGHPLPHPTPAPSLRSLGPGRFAPSQRLRPPPPPPPNVFAHYATVRNVFKFHAYSCQHKVVLDDRKASPT